MVRRVAAVEKAEAEKIAVVKAAEGDAESKYLQGQVSASTSCCPCSSKYYLWLCAGAWSFESAC